MRDVMRIFNIKSRYYLLLLTPLLLVNCSCDDDDPAPPPPTIVISGTVTSASDSGLIKDAQVAILNVETQQNEIDPWFTDATGTYSFTVPTGSYEVRVSAQGYVSSPLDGLSGIPISATQTYDVSLDPITGSTLYGLFKMQLVGYAQSNGALVILTNNITSESFTAATTDGGALTMFNIPVADYILTIKSIGHETYVHGSPVTISDGAETLIDNIALTATAGFTVGGSVTFLAITNAEVDVSLTDQDTGAVIPGTTVTTSNSTYTMTSIAPGSYNILATFKIDGLVVDPDSIVKFGQPSVTVVNANITDGNIDVTGAVSLTSPVLQATGAPAIVDTLTPTLTWAAYASTSDYVVEVLDVDGNVLWGGFTDIGGGLFTKEVTTPNTSIVYSDDFLGLDLVDGETYRWKIYASKDNNQSATGWDLISSSEEAQGVFTVVIP
jgi:hypothetical protein